ncbi:MAG: restriction endonuclease subunit S [Clostridiales bacterium]|uniref:restriction endonuclease subunit S n=1 Tax=Hominenteromicrobium sp. TaxID=3073581 RepID=UPI003A91303C|nr:restriction endonuclease subunit S [Clostridiales bacterium]
MREMKDSGIEWIGQIPTGWKLRRAKTLFTQRNSKGNGIEVLLSPTQKYGVVPQSQLEGVVQVKEDTDLQMFKTLHKGDFVISLRSFQGGFEYSLYEGVCSPAYQVFYPTSPICDTYYRYLFKSQSFISKMNNLTVGIREGKNIQYVDFANSQIPVPPLAEQERIAVFLNAECAEIDAVLEKTRASIEEYKKLKQAIITQAVTKGIRGDRPMKDSGIEWIGDIPAEWNKDKVIRVFSVIGSGTTPKSSDENLFDGNTPWIQSGDINGENLFVTKNCVSNSAIESYSALRVYQAPYLVVAMYGASVGNLSLSMIDACVNQACCVLKKPTINLKFAFYIFKAVKDYLARKAVGGGQPNISQETIKQLWLTIPSADEQIEISNYLDEKCRSVDALIAKKQQYLTEIENYKKSLIYEYVTGKKEVV